MSGGYIGVDNKSKHISKIYVGDNNGLSKLVNKAYIGINNESKLFYTGEYPEPSNEYESVVIDTWNSATDADNFFTIHTPQNGWAGLKLGNIIKIKTIEKASGTVYVQWKIAGFNCEHNQTAADGTIYDNGYGICMIANSTMAYGTSTAGGSVWSQTKGGYLTSILQLSLYLLGTDDSGLLYLPKDIVKDHIVERNVLLSNSVDSNYKSNSYRWTKSYATSLSVCQLTGQQASHTNKYDDGEATYKLPLFNYEDYRVPDSSYWLRNIDGKHYLNQYAYFVGSEITFNAIGNDKAARPMIYLR